PDSDPAPVGGLSGRAFGSSRSDRSPDAEEVGGECQYIVAFRPDDAVPNLGFRPGRKRLSAHVDSLVSCIMIQGRKITGQVTVGSRMNTVARRQRDMRIAICILLTAGSLAMLSYAADPAPLTPVPYTQVKVEDEFWAPRIKTCVEKTIPHVFKMCEETG